MFAIDCVLCRTMSQLFACVLVPCVSNWCEETVTVICHEVSSPVMVDEIYEYIPNLHGNHTLCNFMNDCRIILKQKNPSEGSDVRSSKRTANPSIPTMLAVAQ